MELSDGEVSDVNGHSDNGILAAHWLEKPRSFGTKKL